MVEETDIPPLTTCVADREAEQIDALRLIADSVAQQRQTASRAIISHPVVLTAVIAILAIISQYLFDRRGDLTLVVSTVAGCALTWMAAIGYLTSGYIEHAEQTGTWAWLHEGRVRISTSSSPSLSPPSASRTGENRSSRRRTAAARVSSRRDRNQESDNDNSDTNSEDQEPIDREYEDDQDTIIVTRYGGQIIGALVLRSPPVSSPSIPPVPASTSQGSSANDGNKKATIRAWTVRIRYRNKGIGTGLLEYAVSQCRSRGWPGPVFAEQHANSARLVPRWFHASFEKRERRARASLQEVIVASETGVPETER
jgi:acetyltransferase (GNAT) family protein